MRFVHKAWESTDTKEKRATGEAWTKRVAEGRGVYFCADFSHFNIGFGKDSA